MVGHRFPGKRTDHLHHPSDHCAPGVSVSLDAVAAPRLHCSFDGKVSLEAAYMRDDIPKALEKMGFSIDIREPMSFYLGCIQMVLSENDEFIGVADPRRDGSAGGPEK